MANLECISIKEEPSEEETCKPDEHLILDTGLFRSEYQLAAGAAGMVRDAEEDAFQMHPNEHLSAEDCGDAGLMIAATAKRIRRPNWTSLETSVLLDSLMSEPDLLAGKIPMGQPLTYLTSRWSSVASQVNAVSSNQRTGDECKNKWSYLKSETKTKFARKRKQMVGANALPPISHFSEIELRVLRLIPELAIGGIQTGSSINSCGEDSISPLLCILAVSPELPVSTQYSAQKASSLSGTRQTSECSVPVLLPHKRKAEERTARERLSSRFQSNITSSFPMTVQNHTTITENVEVMQEDEDSGAVQDLSMIKRRIEQETHKEDLVSDQRIVDGREEVMQKEVTSTEAGQDQKIIKENVEGMRKEIEKFRQDFSHASRRAFLIERKKMLLKKKQLLLKERELTLREDELKERKKFNNLLSALLNK